MVSARHLLGVLTLVVVPTLLQARSVPAIDSSESVDSLTTFSLDSSRFAVGIGLGVAGVSAQDIVALINQEMGPGAVSSNSFASAATFSSAVTWRFDSDFDISANQLWLSRSYEFGRLGTGITTYTYDLMELGLIVHRVFPDGPSCLSVGAGGGIVFGSLQRSYSTNPTGTTSTVTGGVMNVELVFRSAFAGHFFLHTELRGGITFTGSVKDQFGNPYQLYDRPDHTVTLGTAGAGLTVGVDYCF